MVWCRILRVWQAASHLPYPSLTHHSLPHSSLTLFLIPSSHSHPGSWKKDQCHAMSHYGAGDYQSLFATPHSHFANSLASTSTKGGKARKALARAWAMRMKPHSALAKAIQAAATADSSAGSASANNAQQASAQQATPQQQQGANAPAAEPAVTASSNTTASSS